MGRSVTAVGDEVVMTGEFQGIVDFGPATLTSAGIYNIFVVRTTP